MSRQYGGDLSVLPEQYRYFASEMLRAAPDETVAVGTAGWWLDSHGDVHLTWRDFRIAGPGDYLRRGPGGAEVAPMFLAPSVKRCRETGEALILAHTHPFSSAAQFSGIDDGGENTLIPKVRARAPNAPHGAIVLGNHGASVRVWPIDADRPIDIELRIRGQLRAGQARGAVYARQELALGPGTAATLGAARIAIVGTGGLGWDLATLLWGHGIGGLILVDPDVVADHNRPRLRGSRPTDVERPKVVALAELLREARSDGELVPIAASFEAAAARESVASCDLIVLATDNLRSRLDVDRFARRLLIPVVDSGINIQLQEGRIRRIGGRTTVSYPSGPCLSCMGIVDPDAVAAEADPLGYRGVAGAEEASVGALNATVAGLAAVQVLNLLLGFGPAWGSKDFRYDGLAGIVREVAVPATNKCGTCGELLGAVIGSLP